MSFEQIGLHRSVQKMVPKPMGLCRKLNFVENEDENMNHSSFEEGLNSSGVSSEDFAEPGVVTSSPIDKEKERICLLSPTKMRFPQYRATENYRTAERMQFDEPPMSPPHHNMYRRVKALKLTEDPNTPKTLCEKCSDTDIQPSQLLKLSCITTLKKCPDTPAPVSRQRSLSLRSRPGFCTFTPNETERLPSPPVNQFTPKAAENPKKRTRSKSLYQKEEICDIDSDDEQPSKRIALHESNISRYHKEFHEIRKIGTGDFGTVYICRNRLDGCDYAIKKSLKPVAGSSDEKMAIREVQAHAILGKHPHVVRYYSAWAENDHMIIQNEYCNGGSLAGEMEERLKCGKMFSEPELKEIMSQVAEGLRYIHSMNLAHLDIKPGNIFISRETRYDSADDGFEDEDPERDEVTYKIGDLGHVTSITDAQVEEGDCRYLPLEVLQEDFRQLTKADIFSLGLTIYELAGGGPLPKNGDLWQKIRNEGYLPRLPHLSTEMHELLLSTIRPNASARPSAAELLHSSVLGGYSRNSTEQLRRELKAERLKNQALRKQLLKAQLTTQPMVTSPNKPTPKRSQRLVGKNMAKSLSYS